MFEFKPILPEAIPNALEKAVRYRLLNEPREAESICRDVLVADPENQQGYVVLLLALTDQFAGCGVHLDEAKAAHAHIRGEYERAYYEGVVLERWGKAQLHRDTPSYVVNDWLQQAMDCYTRAEAIRPPGNDDAILRWNACARIIKRSANESRTPAPSGQGDCTAGFDEEVPLT